jgi:phospholipid/cholesterol/gamma-HCH transport system substrate-binding protein
MSFFLGVFRFDRIRYNHYIVYFDDVSGLEKKADVKIAGVKVGWVEKIDLIPNDHFQARADVMVSKNYQLHQDAYAVVRQEGVILI